MTIRSNRLPLKKQLADQVGSLCQCLLLFRSSEVSLDKSAFMLQSSGVVDVDGVDIPDAELTAHAFANVASAQGFSIQRGASFVSEYPRRDIDTGLLSIGTPSDPSHLGGGFPHLFPFGEGIPETDRPVKVPYEQHAQWALDFVDRRFRLDTRYIFQVFGVIQKRKICASAALQIKRSSYVQYEAAIQGLSHDDFTKAAEEEASQMPAAVPKFTNPTIAALWRHLTAVRSRVPGSDESRMQMRPMAFGTIAAKGPPDIWLTLNPPDTQDPIAQVLTGQDIDLDVFNRLDAPSMSQRSTHIAQDPFAAAQYFRVILSAVVSTLLGVEGCFNDGKKLVFKEGIFGTVSALITAFETQGRGTLHAHMILWLEGSPSPSLVKKLLTTQSFRDRVSRYHQYL